MSFASAGMFLVRQWKVTLPIAAIAVLAILLVIRTGQRDEARQATSQAQAETRAAVAAHDAFAQRVRAKAERIVRAAAENVVRVEREQQQISQEVSHAYQARIADARARAERLRREREDRARSGGGPDAMPGLPDAAGGPDAAAGGDRLSVAERLVATEQAIRLEELQNWIRRQLAVSREAPPIEGDE